MCQKIKIKIEIIVVAYVGNQFSGSDIKKSYAKRFNFKRKTLQYGHLTLNVSQLIEGISLKVISISFHFKLPKNPIHQLLAKSHTYNKYISFLVPTHQR